MNDSLSPLTAPPPRYLLESDSSDEEGQGHYPSSSRARAPAAAAPPAPAVRALAPLDTAHAVVAVGQVGRYLLRRVTPGPRVLDLSVGARRIGGGFKVGDAVLVLVDEPEHAAAFALAKALLGVGEGITCYVPSMYIPDPAEASAPDPPVRLLSAGPPSTLPTFDAPNYLSGLAAAMLTIPVILTHQATHPLSPHGAAALAVPLPLSSLAPAALPDALAALGVPLTLARAHWDDDDDEPFAGLGMGARRAPPGPAARVETSSMYM